MAGTIILIICLALANIVLAIGCYILGKKGKELEADYKVLEGKRDRLREHRDKLQKELDTQNEALEAAIKLAEEKDAEIQKLLEAQKPKKTAPKKEVAASEEKPKRTRRVKKDE